MTAPRWQDIHGPTWNGLDTELSPGQSWAIPAGPQWQARLDRAGRAHVVGRALAEQAEHGPRYLDAHDRGIGEFLMWPFGETPEDRARPDSAFTRRFMDRPWHTFARANRVASYHERLWLAAKRQAAQTGQGGE